jgi:uncharacterized protein (TIGR02246 family)
MSDHPLKSLIEAADRAISARDYDALMRFYAEDATLVVRPGLNVRGREQIRRAFQAIGEHFQNTLSVSQGKMVVLEGGATALVLMETLLEYVQPDGSQSSARRAATYVFREEADGRWLCVVDNSYGTDLLTAPTEAAAAV